MSDSAPVFTGVTANARVVRALVTLAQLQSEGRMVCEPSHPLRTPNVALTGRVVGVTPGFGTPNDVAGYVITSCLPDRHDDRSVDAGTLFQNIGRGHRSS